MTREEEAKVQTLTDDLFNAKAKNVVLLDALKQLIEKAELNAGKLTFEDVREAKETMKNV